MSGYGERENYKPRGGSRGGYQGKNYNSGHSSTSHRDDRFGSDARAEAASRYNSYNHRERYHERDRTGADRAPFPDSRERTSGFNSPIDSRDGRRPDLLDMSRVRDRSGQASPSTGGYSAGGQMPQSARPSFGSSEKLVDEIKKMMRTVGHNLMLENQRDAAKRNYDSTLKIYKETMGMKETFPSTEYLARQDRDEAQATLDRLEHELRQAEASFSAKNMARYLEELVPAAAATKPSKAVEEELATSKRQIESQNAQIKNLVARLNACEAEIKKADTTARSASGQASKQSNRIDEVHQRQLHSMTYINKISEMEKKLNDLAASQVTTQNPVDASVVEVMRKRLVNLENQMAQTMTTQKGLDGKISALGTNGASKQPGASSKEINPEIRNIYSRLVKVEENQNTQDSQMQLVNGRIDAAETTLTELATIHQRVDKDLQQLNQNMESFDEDIFKLSKQLDTLQSTPSDSQPSTQTPSRPTNADAMDLDNPLTQATPRRGAPMLSEKAEAFRKQLKVSPAVFAALGDIPATLKGLMGMKEYLSEAQGKGLDELNTEFTQQLDQLRNELLPRLQELDVKEKELEGKQEKLKTDHEALYHQTAALAALPQPGATSAPAPAEQNQPALQQGLQFAAIEDLNKKIDEMDNKYGILHRGLDTRMQNTHSDELAHQILGSLQSAYPNLAHTDEVLREANVARQAMERQIGDLKRTSDKVREVVNAQGLEVQAGKKTRQEMEGLAREVREKVQLLENKVAAVQRMGGNAPQGGSGGPSQVQVLSLGEEVRTLHGELDTVKHTAEDARHALQRIKLDMGDRFRAYDTKLAEVGEKLIFDDKDSIKDKIVILTDFSTGLEEDVKMLKEKIRGASVERRAGDKRTASVATSPTESDVPMVAGGERRKRRKKKRTGAFLPDDSDEDPYE